jgi:NAD(P)-dependent dehydrogenase (short-subunit alcohol dehydrogenase family)
MSEYQPREPREGGRGVTGLLSGKVALVTGAGQGLGRAIAREMAAEGATVWMLDRNAERLAEAAEAIRAEGGHVEPRRLDVTDLEGFTRLIGEIAERGPIDVLVNNAAINPATLSILEDTPENWRRTLDVNLDAVWTGSRLVAPHMVRQGSGRIIHVSSVQGFVSSGRCESYNAAKGAVVALTKSMAVELAPHSVLVNCVAPGFLRTPMAVVDGVDETETPEFRDWYIGRRRIPLRRAGEPRTWRGRWCSSPRATAGG